MIVTTSWAQSTQPSNDPHSIEVARRRLEERTARRQADGSASQSTEREIGKLRAENGLLKKQLETAAQELQAIRTELEAARQAVVDLRASLSPLPRSASIDAIKIGLSAPDLMNLVNNSGWILDPTLSTERETVVDNEIQRVQNVTIFSSTEEAKVINLVIVDGQVTGKDIRQCEKNEFSEEWLQAMHRRNQRR